MGQGGIVTLVNATTVDWQIIESRSYQMSEWNWPRIINAGTSVSVYTEFERKALPGFELDDSGDADYSILDGLGTRFQIRARSTEGRNHDVRVGLTNISLGSNAPQGHEIYLSTFTPPPSTTNWRVAKFVVAGTRGDYMGTSVDTLNWMGKMLPLIGDRPLRQLCIPGSHDSGMSVLRASTRFRTEANTKTQTDSIFRQLVAGVRVFDLRCAIRGWKPSGSIFGRVSMNWPGAVPRLTYTYETAHYSHTPVGWQGAFGQSFEEIVNDINNFTSQVRNELLIFSLSHALDLTHAARGDVPSFTKEQWDGLFGLLTKVNQRCNIISDLKTDASNIELSRYVANGNCVLFVVEDSKADLSSWVSQGFILDRQLPYFRDPYNKFSDTDDDGKLVREQISHMRQIRNSQNSDVCLLQWILSVKGADNVGGKGIIAHTARCNLKLYQDLWNACTQSTYPNVIMIDDCDAQISYLCVAINRFFVLRDSSAAFSDTATMRMSVAMPMDQSSMQLPTSTATPLPVLDNVLVEKSAEVRVQEVQDEEPSTVVKAVS